MELIESFMSLIQVIFFFCLAAVITLY